MPFYEVIYENGDYSVAFYEDDAEAERALSAHHERAKAGELAYAGPNPLNQAIPSAVRVKRCLVYEEHPATFNESQIVQSSEVNRLLKEALDEVVVGDLVSVPELASRVRDITSPLVESGRHESNYKMKESRELAAKKWGGD